MPRGVHKNGTVIDTNGRLCRTNSYIVTMSHQENSEEWVEIIEPKTRAKIYANLETGVCARNPPHEALVRRTDDFSDHWWELYDEKTGKFYYYNPEQQKTAWTKPEISQTVTNSNSERRKLLIIPVSKLKTFKKTSPDRSEILKCDACTQTESNNSVSIGTQTPSDDEIFGQRSSSNLNARISRRNLAGGGTNNYNCFSEIVNSLNAANFVDDEDEDCLNGDSSSIQKSITSQNIDESGEGWKLPSEERSPKSPSLRSHAFVEPQNSPLQCETSSLASNFTFDDLVNEEKDPSSCMTQQLDHRKLVENFKKSRQTSSFGAHDFSLGRSNREETHHAMQKLRNVADSYFNHDRGEQHGVDNQLRKLSVLSTLPRLRKDSKIVSQKLDDTGAILDADYDVVEENCGYFSDSDRVDRSRFNSGLMTKVTQPDDGSCADITNPETPFDRNRSTRGSTFSVESFARENLSKHAMKAGGLFHRKVDWSKMISWTKSGIKHPMITSVGTDLSSESVASFKLVQQFMSDREVTMSKKYRQIIAQTKANDRPNSVSGTEKNSARSYSGNKSIIESNSTSNTIQSNVPDRIRDELAYELILKGCSHLALRDEIYIQLARQLTDNPSQEGVRLGLILMSILLSYFSPSVKFSPFLIAFLETHPHRMARDVCLPRLRRRLRQSWLTHCRKPTDGDEVTIVRLSITKWPQYCGVFGESLEHIMSLQTCSPYLRTLRLPWILTTLSKKLLETGGAETEGIFRCAADHDLIAQLRLEIDCVDFRKITDAKQVHSLLSNVQDPHVIAGLLKLFFRQLTEPVFPTQVYELCLQSSQDGYASCRIFNEHLSNLHKDVVAYLIRLLQHMSKNDNVIHTKMDTSNLSMVWAPNLLRAPDQNKDDSIQSFSSSKWSISNLTTEEQHCNNNNHQPSPVQSMIFEQTRQEMQFIRSLIANLDTSFIDDVN